MYGVYALFDRVRESYSNITIDNNDNTAKRSFLAAVANSRELMYIAKDLELRKVAEFDIHSGMIVPLAVSEFICYGSEYENV